MQKLFFLHIPKAGGQTIYEIIKRQYLTYYTFLPLNSKKIFLIRHERDVDEFLSLPKNKIEKLSIIMGHFPYGIQEKINEDYKIITFLRHPVKRIISHYYYVINTPQHYLHEVIVKRKMTLKDYLESRITLELDNGQVRQLSGKFKDVEFGGELSELYNLALENLNKMDFVGILEKFDESILLMKNMFNWRMPYYNIINKGKQKKKFEINSDLVELIKENNIYDLKLYSAALENLNNKIAAAGNNFSSFVQTFKRKNHYFNKIYTPYLRVWDIFRYFIKKSK